jgi:type II secretory pathway component GspD/PulD (secretin)
MKHLIICMAFLLPGCGTMSEENGAPENMAQSVEMITLQYAVAGEVFDALKILLGDPPSPPIAPDPRTNSIIVVGTPGEIDLVKEVISTMDVKAPVLLKKR